jgi:hypothetical protein
LNLKSSCCQKEKKATRTEGLSHKVKELWQKTKKETRGKGIDPGSQFWVLTVLPRVGTERKDTVTQ